MFTSIADFVSAWKYETDTTLKVYRALTDTSLSQAVAPGHRTIGRMAWHTVTTITEMLNNAGLGLVAVPADAPVPAKATDIANGFEKAANELLAAVQSKWTDADLMLKHDFYGEQWTSGYALFCLIAHHSHHRGQVTVLMRQAGLVVPGIYGPALEEWAQMGAPIPAI